MLQADPQWIRPAWPVPEAVQALITTRAGGHSQGPWGAPGGGGMNLGAGSDDPLAVARNRARLRALLPAEPCWLEQVHGAVVVDAAALAGAPQRPHADAAFTTAGGVVCCVLTADCLPVLLADAAGRGVAAAHAGWRGLAGGVIQNTVAALRHGLGEPDAQILAYLGPAIGPDHFVVGPEVLEAMQQRLPAAEQAFVPHGPGKYRADLFALAVQALAQAGVAGVYGGGLCTVGDAARFYSFRRESPTGRQAALIWLKDSV
jgi:YfiH family protein